MKWAAACGSLGLLWVAACGDGAVDSPFVPQDSGTSAGDAGMADAGLEDDAGVASGKPCLDDGQCDDGIACTFDECRPNRRCNIVPDHSQCTDGVYCNGVEQCDVKHGCRAGPPVACSDVTPCTIDRCIEEDQSCRHDIRDADGDGDVDRLCVGEGDCNDNDPSVSSQQVEICNNAKDDDCDQEVDEEECELPAHDTCDDPFVISAAGSYTVSTVALDRNYLASCLTVDAIRRDLVLAIEVEGDDEVDVDIVARAEGTSLELASYDECADVTGEGQCSVSGTALAGDSLARLRLRNPGAGSHSVVLFSEFPTEIALEVSYEGALPEAGNETCNSAMPLEPAQPAVARGADAQRDVPSICGTIHGELVYSFTLDAEQDVHLFARSLDGYGEPQLSLRDSSCLQAGNSELTCRRADGSELFARALDPGDYFVAVGATGPSDVEVVLELAEATEAPEDESCQAPPELEPGELLTIDLTQHTDDVFDGCLPGGVDAVYALSVEEPTDVLLIQRASPAEVAAVSLFAFPCDADHRVSCTVSNLSPVRTAAHNLGAGTYAVVAETSLANATTVDVLTRPARAPTIVAFADTCAAAVEIPAAGGFFQGNTANATAHYDAGCDLPAQGSGGAREQMLKLVLAEEKRVVLDMLGSAFATLLSVRRGPECPGTEVAGGCAAGFKSDRSFLDLTLPAGEYFLQIDGFARDEGAWFLDVYVVDP